MAPFYKKYSNFQSAAFFHHLYGKGKSAAILSIELFLTEWSRTYTVFTLKQWAFSVIKKSDYKSTSRFIFLDFPIWYLMFRFPSIVIIQNRSNLPAMQIVLFAIGHCIAFKMHSREAPWVWHSKALLDTTVNRALRSKTGWRDYLMKCTTTGSHQKKFD